MNGVSGIWDEISGGVSAGIRTVATAIPGIGPAIAIYDTYGRLIGINDATNSAPAAVIQNGNVVTLSGQNLGPVDRVAEGIREGTAAVGTGVGKGLQYAIIAIGVIGVLYAIYNIEKVKRFA